MSYLDMAKAAIDEEIYKSLRRCLRNLDDRLYIDLVQPDTNEDYRAKLHKDRGQVKRLLSYFGDLQKQAEKEKIANRRDTDPNLPGLVLPYLHEMRTVLLNEKNDASSPSDALRAADRINGLEEVIMIVKREMKGDSSRRRRITEKPPEAVRQGGGMKASVKPGKPPAPAAVPPADQRAQRTGVPKERLEPDYRRGAGPLVSPGFFERLFGRLGRWWDTLTTTRAEREYRDLRDRFNKLQKELDELALRHEEITKLARMVETRDDALWSYLRALRTRLSGNLRDDPQIFDTSVRRQIERELEAVDRLLATLELEKPRG